MPTLTITNLTSSPVLVQELYAFVPASGTLATERTQADVEGMPSFLSDVADGNLSYAITYSADEQAAGAVNLSESVLDVGIPDTAGAATVHGAFAGNDAALDYPGAFTDPDQARNLVVTFAAAYNGGDTTVVGTNQFGAAISEVFAENAGAATTGAKMFATVTSATKELVGDNAATATIGTGTVLGLNAQMGAETGNLIFADGAGEAGTWDETNNSVDPASAPNGALAYVAVVKS